MAKVKERWDFRVASQTDELVRQAAATADRTLTDFVVDAAVVEAERVLADRTQFVLETEQWARFVELLDRPPQDKPGLEKLFSENGTWASVRVTPASGTTACLGMILSIYLDLAFRRLRLGLVARPMVAGINGLAGAIDGRSARLREPGPGTLFANYHVVAEVPR